MKILRNNIIAISETPLFDAGTYRILEIFTFDETICLFRINQKTKSAKPLLISFSDFYELFDDGAIRNLPDALPKEMLLPDSRLSEDNRRARDKNFSRIKDLVENPTFLNTFCSSPRSRVVIEHAERNDTTPLQLYRILKKYWEYGQVPNALLNFTSPRGGRGKDKASSSKQRGRPIEKGVYGLRKKVSVNVTEQDKANILLAIRSELSNKKKLTFTKAHTTYKEMFCETEIGIAKTERRPAQTLSYDQFLYWGKKLITKEDIIASQISKSSFSSNHEGSLSSVSDKFTAPGFRYEIDSTIADVYIVCEVSRQRVLGRPTIYSVVDVASRMIVGMHVSMEHASWNAARQALYNACMPKVDYCKRYGVTITEEEWPCVGMPANLMADRGEMLGEKPFAFALNAGTILNIAPPYRGDLKAIVERRFGILNEAIHFLPGSTLGQLRERGEPDYRLDAAITLSALTKILIDLILEHNNVRPFEDIITRDFVENDLEIVPLNYWKLYTSKHQCSLKNFSENHFVAKLMKDGVASVRGDGIIFKGRRYICQKAIDEQWTTRALNNGSWKVECKFDESWSTDIYIRENNSAEFLKCTLLSADSMYSNLHEADIIFIDEWKRAKSELPDYDHSKIERSKRTQVTVKEEIKLTSSVAGGVSNRAKVLNISKHRREHLAAAKPKFPDVEINSQPSQATFGTKSDRMRALFESTRNRDEEDV